MSHKLKMYEHPKVIRDAWATIDAFRRLGFAGEHLWFIQGPHRLRPDTGLWVSIELKTQGKIFSVEVGRSSPMTQEECEAAWLKFGELYNSRDYDMDEAQRVFLEGPVFTLPGGTARFMSLLLSKGFVIPSFPRS